MRPRYVTRDEVPADVVDTERRIAEATAREEGKPEAALPKIVEGRLNGFFKDNVLLEQASVQDTKKTVKARAGRGRRDRDPVRAFRGRRLTRRKRPGTAGSATSATALPPARERSPMTRRRVGGCDLRRRSSHG